MSAFIRKNRIQLLTAIIGAIGGFLYWKFIGCETGTCPIKSVWYYTVLWGTLAGYLVGDIVDGIIRKRKKREDE